MRQVWSIPAPSEAAAWDLAFGGLVVFRPRLIERKQGWEVTFAAPTNELDAVSAMVRYWLRRSRLREVVVRVSGYPLLIRARHAREQRPGRVG